MDLTTIQRRGYEDGQQDDTDKLKHSSEDNKFVLIHFSIIISVLISLILIGVLLYIYRRKIQNSFSKNLNRIVHVSHITHLKNPDDGVFNSLDYYSNNYDDSHMSPKPEDSSYSKENRNYIIYGKSSRIRSDINNLNKRETNDITKRDDNNTKSNRPISSALKSKLNSILRPKINVSQISSPITSPSESIYDNGKANSLASTSTRVIPPIPTFTSNKYTQSAEILRGPQMTSVTNGNYLINKSPNAIITDANITAAVTTGTSEATTTTNNSILSFMSKFKKHSPSFITPADNGMTKGDDSNKIIINEITEVIDHNKSPINGFSNHDNSYARLSRESNIYDEYTEYYRHK